MKAKSFGGNRVRDLINSFLGRRNEKQIYNKKSPVAILPKGDKEIDLHGQPLVHLISAKE
jgi:hypothetical protein